MRQRGFFVDGMYTLPAERFWARRPVMAWRGLVVAAVMTAAAVSAMVWRFG